jgi:hypothetical protein
MTCLRKVIVPGLGLFCLMLLSLPATSSNVPASPDTDTRITDGWSDQEVRGLIAVPARDGSTADPAKREIQLLRSIPQRVRARLADGNYPDRNGMIGTNRSGWRCAAYQRGGMFRLMLSAVAGDQAAVTDSWRAIDATFARQNADGSFQIASGMHADYLDRLNDVSFWLAKLCHALLIVQASEIGPAFEARIHALLPKIELSAMFLAGGVNTLSTGDRDAANRLFFHACAYGLSGYLLGNQQLMGLGRQLAAQGMGEQRADGVFLEMHGYDSSYQGVSLLQLQQYALHFPAPATDAALLRGAQWEVGRILPTGQIDASGNTRTGHYGKQVSYIEVMTGLLYCGAAQGYQPATDAGLRVFTYFYHMPLGSQAPGSDVADAETLVPSVVLHQNYPNPFSSTTTIGYTLPSGQDVRVGVYNTLGQRVRTLASGRSPEGYSMVTWDSKDDSGNPVSPGAYVVRLETRDAIETRKVLLVE